MANRPLPSDVDLATFSRDLKRLIEQAQRLRDKINRYLSAADALSFGRPTPTRPSERLRVR
jgi:hypothetical protein